MSIDFLIKIVKNQNGQDEVNPLIREIKSKDGKIDTKFKKYKTIELYVGGQIEYKNSFGKTLKFVHSGACKIWKENIGRLFVRMVWTM